MPDLTRNRMYLWMIDQLGCSIKVEYGQIHVIAKGMKGIRRNDMCVLVGLLPQLGINASVSNDKTKLWHNKIEHISEKGLKELRKQELFSHNQISSLKTEVQDRKT